MVVVTEAIAACITADGHVEESEIDMATALIENDELILNKKNALDLLKSKIDSFSAEREKSMAIFKLKMTTVAHNASSITDDLQKDRIRIVIDSILEASQSNARPEVLSIADKIKEKIGGNILPNLKSAAEGYILHSGDTEAINALRQMQSNPAAYNQQFRQAAKGNSIMRTALGVFTGMIAADFVTSAIHQHQLEEALSNFNAEIEKMGGLDNFPIENGEGFHTAELQDYSETGNDSLDGEYDTDVALNDDLDDSVDIDTDDFDLFT